MSEIAGLGRHAVRGAATTIVGQGLRFLVQLASVAILARLLTAADFGSYSMVMSIVGVAAVLGDFGLSLASIQSQSLTMAQRSNLFWTNAGIGVLIAALVVAASGPIAAFYDRPQLAPIAAWTSLVFLLNALVPQFRAEATVKLRFVSLSLADVGAQLIGLLVAVALALLGFRFWALVWQQVAIAVVTLIITAVVSRWRPRWPARGQEMRRLYSFGASTLGVQVINYLAGNVDNITVGRLDGATALGYYSRAYQLFQLPLQQIASPMTRVALPILSRIQATEHFERYIERAQRILAYTFGGAFFALVALASPLVDILLGHRWAPVTPIFTVLAAGGIFQALGYVYYWIFIARAKTGLQLRFNIVGRGLMIGLIIAGGFLGPLGVAIGVSAGQAVVWLIYTLFAIPRTGVSAGRLAVIAARPIAVYCGMIAIALPLEYGVFAGFAAWARLALLAAVCLTYLALVVALFPGVRADLRDLRNAALHLRGRGGPPRGDAGPADASPPAASGQGASGQGAQRPDSQRAGA